jgi:hypothetical protein
MSLFCIYLCGGDHIEDITSYLGGTFSMRPNTKAASSDTIARALKELAQDNVIYRSDSGASYAFNTAEKLNRLLLSMLFRLGLLEKGGVLDLDIAFSDKFYTYRCIVTNDWESTEEEIIHQPFSFLKENTVFRFILTE